MNNLLIIDKENSKYLVRPTLIKWVLTAGYSVPKKSKKGFVGSKWNKDYEKDFLPDYEANAIELFEKYKEKYKNLLKNKEIVRCYLTLYPVIDYYVTCPVCGKNAEICTFLIMFTSGEGESLDIFCPHCAGTEDPLEQLNNKVGICYDSSFFMDKKEIHFEEELKVNNIKWEDWIKGK